MRMLCIAGAMLVFLMIVPNGGAYPHSIEYWGIGPIEWKNEYVTRIVTNGDGGKKTSIEGKGCLTGGNLHFDVNDRYAFDIDETVWLDVEFYVPPGGSKAKVLYDRNDFAPITAILMVEPEARKEVELAPSPNERWQQQSIALERARFANLGFAGTDLAIEGDFTLCKMSLRRSNATTRPSHFGEARIDVLDERGSQTPARMGIYDKTGRLPLPSDAAVDVRDLNRDGRVVSLRESFPQWPVKNRSIFYTNGQYHAKLPVGEYELVVSKGPEYRIERRKFSIEESQTRAVKITLRRWVDMASKNWYSGDAHIHYVRENESDDRNLLILAQAEDLNVSNILQMGNIANTYFRHYDWAPVAARDGSFVLVPGQEDPRTSRRGHAIQLNIRGPVRDPAQYLMYHKVFESARAQGGVVGYAHLNEALDVTLNATRGMAVDMPYGLVDFAEILSLGSLVGVSTWFDFLNLGFKLSPSAGTDYPWGGLPGAVRNYVKVDGQFTSQGWFDGLKQGHTFVTNGPMLEIKINEQGPGSETHVSRGERVSITAKAFVNPDVDKLSYFELIEQGGVIRRTSSAQGASSLSLDYDFTSSHSTWFVLRAHGQKAGVIALSAPLYVLVGDERFWKREEVPKIVQQQRRKMEELLRSDQQEKIEAWEVQGPDAKYWGDQRDLLRKRIADANAIYDRLVKSATAASE